MKMNETLYEKLAAYGNQDVYPFHMPGHKRRKTGSVFDQAFQMDITEIPGFDNLHHPEDLLKEEMRFAASFYQTKETFFLVNGSSCGVLASICGSTRREETILLARNSHKSAYHAVYLNALQVSYLYPQKEEEFLPVGPIAPEDVRKQMEETGSKVVFLTSPTYEGVLSNIKEIAQIVHAKEGILIVDEAHGAHLPFGEKFPESAITSGADLVIQSLHKTMPTFTQTALLHVCSDRVDIERIKQYLSIVQTSSPSYLFLSSISACLHAKEQMKEEMEEYFGKLTDFYEQAKSCTKIRILDANWVFQTYEAQMDPSKIVICVDDLLDEKGQIYDGARLAKELSETYHLEMEMVSMHYVLAMTSVRDSKEGFERLLHALFEIDQRLQNSSKQKQDGRFKKEMDVENESCLSIYQALEETKKSIPWGECVGKISGEYLYLYPPGSPIVVPGERISPKKKEEIDGYRERGLFVQGTKDYDLNQIEVLYME